MLAVECVSRLSGFGVSSLKKWPWAASFYVAQPSCALSSWSAGDLVCHQRHLGKRLHVCEFSPEKVQSDDIDVFKKRGPGVPAGNGHGVPSLIHPIEECSDAQVEHACFQHRCSPSRGSECRLYTQLKSAVAHSTIIPRNMKSWHGTDHRPRCFRLLLLPMRRDRPQATDYRRYRTQRTVALSGPCSWTHLGVFSCFCDPGEATGYR